MIEVKTPIYPRPLGDRINTILFCHYLSVVKNTRVNLQIDGHDAEYFNSLMFGDVSINGSGKIDESIVYRHSQDSNIAKYLSVSTRVNIPIKNSSREKFITVQWDAQQKYRTIDPERIQKIESYYKNQGFDIVRIGGHQSLSEIENLLSRATHHVGADSGMMHFAKLLMPTDKIHLYINIRRRENDERFPDGWNVAWQAREILRLGAKMNLCENPSSEQIEYFKKVDLYDKKC